MKIPIRFGDDRGFHLEESQQVGQEQGLIGDTGSSGEHLLQVAGSLNDGVGRIVELADAVEMAGDRAPDHKRIRAVVAECGDYTQRAAGNQLLAREGDVSS